jgi:hypothetical protein
LHSLLEMPINRTSHFVPGVEATLDVTVHTANQLLSKWPFANARIQGLYTGSVMILAPFTTGAFKQACPNGHFLEAKSPILRWLGT